MHKCDIRTHARLSDFSHSLSAGTVTELGCRFPLSFLLTLSFVLATAAGATQIPTADARVVVRTDRSSWPPLEIADTQAWARRAGELRQRILFSAGLLPFPPRTPLRPQIFGRIVIPDFTADTLRVPGYTVEKVYFESLPGFFVTGNLYRPSDSRGPHPGVLSPHGHWEYGRLENTESVSEPGRAIGLARQGYVVFTYDMVGYNDSYQVLHDYASARAQLWGFGVLGLQLWNSIRALDFLEGLPDVDPKRLAVTGASGGGTQTFLLAAVDDRVRVSVPVNMVSAYFQGGDNCEGAPGLRLDASNVEIAALAAPRPMLLVSATGDWTRDTPRIEYPAIRRIYTLLNATERVASRQFHALHNYDRNSREAMYAWFQRWLLPALPPDTLSPPPHEQPFWVQPPADLLVWYGRAKPEGANVDSLMLLWRSLPVDPGALRLALAAEWPDTVLASVRKGGEVLLSRGSDRVEARLWLPGRATRNRPNGAVLLAGDPSPDLVGELLRQQRVVLWVRPFQETRDTSTSTFTTYNRTADQIRVQDVLTGAAYLKREYGAVDLIGTGTGGLWALLARSIASRFRRTVADADRFPNEDDGAYLQRLFIPGLRRAGGFSHVATEAVLVHNTAGAFRAPGHLLEPRLAPSDIAAWVSGREREF